jgi:hypothetical protein
MPDEAVVTFARTTQTITARVLAETRKTYGAVVDDITIQTWVGTAIGALLTEQTRVTTFVPVLAMRDIRELASSYVSSEAA